MRTNFKMIFKFELADRARSHFWSSKAEQRSPERDVGSDDDEPEAVPSQSEEVLLPEPSQSPSASSDELDDELIDHDGYPTIDFNTTPPPQPMTADDWATAAKESLEGVQYVREKYPTENLVYLAAALRKDPVHVEAGDKIVIVEEVTEFIVRVRVVGKDEVGLLPAWNTEDPLQRIARLNMRFNEVVRGQ